MKVLTVKEYMDSRGLSRGQWDRVKAKANEQARGVDHGVAEGGNRGADHGATVGLTYQDRGVWYVRDPEFLDQFLPSTVAPAIDAEIVEVEPVAIAPIPSRLQGQRSQDLAMQQRTDLVLGNVGAIGEAIADRFGDIGEAMADKALARMEQRFNQRLNEGSRLLGQQQGVVQKTTEGNDQ